MVNKDKPVASVNLHVLVDGKIVTILVTQRHSIRAAQRFLKDLEITNHPQYSFWATYKTQPFTLNETPLKTALIKALKSEGKDLPEIPTHTHAWFTVDRIFY